MVISSDNEVSYNPISPTFHEEADARLLLHVWHASTFEGHTKITIKTVDSDVVVLAIYAFPYMLENIEELWVEYGTGKNLQYLPIHQIQQKLSPSVPNLLPSFMLFRGQILFQILGESAKLRMENMDVI